jgi:hypothetical protein
VLQFHCKGEVGEKKRTGEVVFACVKQSLGDVLQFGGIYNPHDLCREIEVAASLRNE